MASRLPYVYEKNGSFYVRLVVPKDLRPFVEKNRGEIMRSLGHSLKEVKANHARALASAQDELDVARARKAEREGLQHKKSVRRYHAMSLDQIARQHYSDELALDMALRTVPDRMSLPQMDWLRPGRIAALSRVAAGNTDNEEAGAVVGWAIDEYGRRGNHRIQAGSPEWRELAMALARVELELIRRTAERDKGDFDGMPKMPALQTEEPDALPPIGFDEIIDAEVKRRTTGKDAAGVRDRTIKQFRQACESFAKHRASDDATTVTAAEGNAWIAHVLSSGLWSAKTAGNALVNARTVLNWGRRQHPDRFPQLNALADIEKPKGVFVPPEERTFTMEEARAILQAAENEKSPTLRFVPWVAAYSGARISEIANLIREDFFQVGDDWFFRITTTGGRTVKTASSIRRVPVHKALIQHGLIKHVLSTPAGDRVFAKRSQILVSQWLNHKLKMKRAHLAPNHSWRHLFEDLCTLGGVSDDARAFMTGRATRTSRDRYGRSEAALPGLAREMAKVPSILEVA